MIDSWQGGWQIYAGNILIGTADFRDTDQPFYICDFVPTLAFENYRSTFDDYAILVNDPTPEQAQIDIGEYYETHIESLNLVLRPFGNVYQGTVFVAQIYDGAEAWLRPV